MAEYLTKEEIRQWRSSLERITLEEFAARLGKVIQGEKETNDMIDKVMTSSLNSMNMTSEYKTPSEKIQTLSLKSHESKITTVRPKTEKPVDKKPAAAEITEKAAETKAEPVKEKPKAVKAAKAAEKVQETAKQETEKQETAVTAETDFTVNVTFKKPLIPREQMIFDFLVKNRGSIVYAKDMAALLELPRDYVYKYIKNLRQKINEDVLCNADNGGYTLNI
ncbi:MAG: hypothetical protein K6C94_03905 [Candidatus Gastranaerophilales bacterium]|nr:hypothetical protein [Candidatus Gastranaerophilales bacterium]